MADISAINSANGFTENSKSKTDAASLMGTTDQFLSILLAQLKHQDPLEPMKGTEFIDSISRLSGVEQSINTNKYLENMTELLKSANSHTGNPVSYIDKNVEFNSSQFALTNKLASFSYTLDETKPQNPITISIKDAAGNIVVNTSGTSKPGVNNIKWDGTNNDGDQLKDGLYTVTISYPDPKDTKKSIELSTFTTGKVTEANFTGDEPTLKVGGVEIPLAAIRKLYGTGA